MTLGQVDRKWFPNFFDQKSASKKVHPKSVCVKSASLKGACQKVRVKKSGCVILMGFFIVINLLYNNLLTFNFI